MKYVECPEIYSGKEKSLFLAGGISGCRIWQDELVNLLRNTNLVLLNPRRKHFDVTRVDIEEKQIKWEFDHLKKADAISFWFPPETVCPITLYELGKISCGKQKMFIGIDPSYSRKSDIFRQTQLARPEVEIVYSLEDLAKQIVEWQS